MLEGHEKRHRGVPDRPDTLKSAHNLGVIYVKMSRYKDAECMSRESLSVSGRPSAPDTLCAAHDLAYNF